MPLPDQICVTMSVKNLCNLNLYNLKKTDIKLCQFSYSPSKRNNKKYWVFLHPFYANKVKILSFKSLDGILFAPTLFSHHNFAPCFILITPI